MKRMKLLIPGPVELSPDVLQAMARPPMGHRTSDFEEILEDCWRNLKNIFQTKNDVLIITGSGTSAMDAAISSTMNEGEEIICIGGGKFGERFIEIANAYGLKPGEVEVEWGDAVALEEVEGVIAESSAKAITLTHNETSTGVVHNAKAVGKIAREYGLLYIMDGITSVGGDEVKADAWGVDICITGSQKCLAAPPGLAMMSVSDKAWGVIDEKGRSNYYLDMAAYRRALRKRTTPYTPSVSLIYGLRVALRKVVEEGLEARVKRHRALAKATREAFKAMNIELFPREAIASNTVTALKIPEGLTDDDIRGRMKREHGILIAGGQAQLKGKIFRIGHMGNVGYSEIIDALTSLESVLKKSGHYLEPGSGLKAAQKIFK
ncbi:MAG: alanine--glyoxylate aminotransferase family protein [Candidatus Hydrothermarchaeota archaeon]|nr:alanine--glyoxylate aminotransferase family protein [Candidatus Hydrothermarchaeota archaeon]